MTMYGQKTLLEYAKSLGLKTFFNDHVWTEENPDLIHAVKDSVYTASVQRQILRDGFNSPDPIASQITANFNPDSVSFTGQTVTWDLNYLASGAHKGSLLPS